MLGQDYRETPDFGKRVVERCGRGADDVRFAEIARCAFLFVTRSVPIFSDSVDGFGGGRGRSRA